MTQTTRNPQQTAAGLFASGAVETVPTELTTAQSKLVYVAINATDGATVDDLATTLDMQKIALLDVCSTLTDRGLVERRDGQYVSN